MTKRIAYARMVMNGALSYHGGCHLIELAELGRQRAREVVGAEALRLKRRGCGDCESNHNSWRGVWRIVTRIAYARMVMNGAHSYHVGLHLNKLPEL